MIRMLRGIVLVLALVLSGVAAALSPDEMLRDPALEQRARVISAQIRCLVCQNESIDDSNADLARDLRRLVRERLAAGDTDGEVIEFLVARYGEFVLLKPRLSARTVLLWGFPIAALLAGIAAMIVGLRRRRSSPVPALTKDELRRIDHLLRDATPPAADRPHNGDIPRS